MFHRYQSEYRLEELMVVPGLNGAAAGRYLAALDNGMVSRLVERSADPALSVLCFNSLFNMMAQEAEAPRWIEELVLRTPFPQMAATFAATPTTNQELWSAIIGLCWVVMQAGGCYRDLMMAQEPCIVHSVVAAVQHFQSSSAIEEAACLLSVLFWYSPLPSPTLIGECIWPFARQCVLERSSDALALHRCATIMHALARCNAGGYRMAMIRDSQVLNALTVVATSASILVNTRCEVVETLAQLLLVPEAHEALYEARAMHALLECAMHQNQFIRGNALIGLEACNQSELGREQCITTPKGCQTLMYVSLHGDSKSRTYALQVVADCIVNAQGTEHATQIYGAWLSCNVMTALCTCFDLFKPSLTSDCVKAISKLFMDPQHGRTAAHAFEEQDGVDKLAMFTQRCNDSVLCEVAEAIIHSFD